MFNGYDIRQSVNNKGLCLLPHKPLFVPLTEFGTFFIVISVYSFGLLDNLSIQIKNPKYEKRIPMFNGSSFIYCLY